MGEGIDERLLISIDRNTIPDGDSGRCSIFWTSITGLDVRGASVHLPCGDLHRYHESCIDGWLIENESRSCPHCKHRFRVTTYDDWDRNSEIFISFFVNYQRQDQFEDEFEEEFGDEISNHGEFDVQEGEENQ